ncbi:MAG: hypothetical protein MSC53_07735 [Arcanobacterium sp.]|nr:hypothetical protein [Arcanobacterium sp.]
MVLTHSVIALTAAYQTSWVAFLLPAVVAVVCLFVPGLLIGAAFGLRGYRLGSWAPVASVAAIAMSAVAAPLLRWRWGVLPVGVGTACLALLAFAVRILLYRQLRAPDFKDGRRPRGRHAAPALSPRAVTMIVVSVAAATYVVAAAKFGTLIHSPGAFGQTWDNAFHLNAIQAILETGNASSFNMNVYQPGSATFYPAAWHGIVSLVALLSGAPATVSSHAVAIAVAFAAWPAGVYSLARVARMKPLEAALTIPFSLVFPQFPWNFLAYGTLYPNLLAYGLMPAALALVVTGIRMWNRTTAMLVAASLVGIIALALAQPNAVIIFAIANVMIFWGFHIRWVWRRYSGIRRVGAVCGVALLWPAVLVALSYGLDAVPALHAMRRGHIYWNAQGTLPEGYTRLFSLTGGWSNAQASMIGYSAMWALAALVLCGIVVLAAWRRQLWILGMYAALGALFIAGYCLEGSWRVYVVGWWYCDVPRLWAPLTMVFALASTASIGALLRLIWHRMAARKRAQIRGIAAGISSALILASMAVGPQMALVNRNIVDAYAITNSSLVDRDEYRLFLWMKQHVPDGAVVAGNPWEGATFAWAVGGVQALFPKITSAVEPDLFYLASHLREANSDPHVCPLLLRNKVTYALDLKNLYLWGESGYGIEKRYPGLDDVADAGIGPVVAQFGEAKLVHITACGS